MLMEPRCLYICEPEEDRHTSTGMAVMFLWVSAKPSPTCLSPRIVPHLQSEGMLVDQCVSDAVICLATVLL